MKKILIVKDVLYGSKLGGGVFAANDLAMKASPGVNSLVDGALAVWTENGRHLTVAAAVATLAAAPDTKSVFFSVGTGNATTGARLSDYIDRASADVRFRAYQAPVLPTVQIGNSGAGGTTSTTTLVVGDEILIRVTDITMGTIPPARIARFSYVVKAGDTMTGATNSVVAGLVAASAASILAGDSNSWVTLTLTGNNNGILVTPNATALGFYGTAPQNPYTTITINVSVDGPLSGSTILADGTANSVLPVFGNGVDAQIMQLEKMSDGEDGDANYQHLPALYFNRPTVTVAGATYDVYSITWDAIKTGPVMRKVATREELLIAVPTGGANLTAAIMASLLGEVFTLGASETETGVN